jgi:hypothetical protein
MDITTALNLYNPGRQTGMADLGKGPGWLSLIPAIDLASHSLGEVDFTSIINRGIDVVGSVFAKQPSQYISPNDPRFQQPRQNVYVSPPPPPGYEPPPSPRGPGVGVQVSQNTLLLIAGAVLIFMVASKR